MTARPVTTDAQRSIRSATLDAHARKAVAAGGLDLAAQEKPDFFRWCPSPREWWRIARAPDGDLAGRHLPAHNASGTSRPGDKLSRGVNGRG
ncbi:hypothetical protein ACIP6Q_27060 [Streptomyces bobili]|uniref:hypothetical protein n=1 Tax=Streptomyces bobili TaxID=67280 RepID=UPI00382D5E9D